MGVGMKQLTITEWFARAVATGLMPECNYAFAEYSKSWHGVEEWSIYTGITENCKDAILIRNVIENPEDEDARVFLRKDGKDLHSLGWRKPTDSDIGKMCWSNDTDDYITLSRLSNVDLDRQIYDEYYFLLLADHDQLSPTEADFKRIYGEQ